MSEQDNKDSNWSVVGLNEIERKDTKIRNSDKHRNDDLTDKIVNRSQPLRIDEKTSSCEMVS